MGDSFDSFSFTEWESALEAPSDALSDDGREFHELKLSSKLTKTNEEIMAFSVDESLGDIDRALYLIKKGQPVQKMSVINGFHRLFEEYPKDSMSLVLPSIAKAAVSTEKNPEFQVSACTFLEEALSTYPCTKKEVLIILDSCKILMKSDLEAVFQSSSKLYLSCIEFGLDRDVLIQIVKSAISNGGFTQPTPSRVWCGKVLCASAPHFTSEEIESIFLEKVLVLCQDTDQEVRCCMGKHIGNIVKVTHPTSVLEKVMTEFIELLKDEERSVRIASLDGLGDVLDSLSESTLIQFIIPTLFSILLDPCLKKGLSKHIGRFLWYCRNLLSDQQKERLLSFYEGLSSDPTQEIPLNCAFHLPAMIKCMGMCPHLQKALQNLGCHPGVAVKTKVATCFSVLCELLTPHAYTHLQELFFSLFDGESCLFQALIHHLENTIQCFLSDSTFRKGTNMDDFILILFRKLRILVENSKWQQAESLLCQLKHVADQFSLEHVYDVCVPILRKIIHNALTFPLKQLALQILIIYTRKFRKIEHRESVCRNLVSDLAFSTDFQKRLLFLRICQEVLTTCSFKFFRQYFAHAFLALSSDAVLSVRRKMASLMPLANKAITVPGVDDAIVKKLGQAREELSINGIELELGAATMEELASDQVLIMEEMASIKDDLESRQRLVEKDKKKSTIKPKLKKNSLQSSSVSPGPTFLESLRKKSLTSAPLGSNDSFSDSKTSTDILPYQKTTFQTGLGAVPSHTSFSHGSLQRNNPIPISGHHGSNSEGMDLPVKKEKSTSLKIPSAPKRLSNR